MTEDSTVGFDKRLSYAWLAGLIDGEGWIGLHKNGYGPVQLSRSNPIITCSYHPIVSVQMTHEPTITRISQVSGFQREYTYRLKSGNHKPLWRWRVDDYVRTRAILEMIGPYLVTKRQQCEVLIKFIDERKFKRGGSTRRTEEDVLYCEYYYNFLKRLNQKGSGAILPSNTV